MLTPIAHVAGLPVEEALLFAGPVAVVWGGLAATRARVLLDRVRRRFPSI